MPSSMTAQMRALAEALKRRDQELRTAAERTAQQAAEAVRDSIRARIPPGAAQSAFPGYAATGEMKNTIVAEPVKVSGKHFTAVVGAARTTSSQMLKVMAAHENGVTIKPKQAKVLAFKLNGKVVFATRAVIKPKHFFRDGWAEGKRLAAQHMQQAVAEAIKQTGGGR